MAAGIRQQLPYGGEIVAQGLFDFVQALNDNVSDGESAELALSDYSIQRWRELGRLMDESCGLRSTARQASLALVPVPQGERS